jgi:phage gp46-like protein
MADIGHFFDNQLLHGDLLVQDGQLMEDPGLFTAVLHSLYSDAKAPEGSDELIRDKRGWWGDIITPWSEDEYGSRLWLLKREKQTPEVLELARLYAEEALAWLVSDGIANEIQVDADFSGRGVLKMSVRLDLVQGKQALFDFNYPWSSLDAS